MKRAFILSALALLLVPPLSCSKDDDDDVQPNQAPIVSSVIVAPATAGRGADILIEAECEDPDGSIVSVRVDLTPLGGSAFTGLSDDGTQGDATPSDGWYSYRYSLPVGLPAQTGISLTVTAVDDEGATGQEVFTGFEVRSDYAPVLQFELVDPATTKADRDVLFTVYVTDADGDLNSVLLDLTSIGGISTHSCHDDGAFGDTVAGDKTYSLLYHIPSTQPVGSRVLTFTATDSANNSSRASVTLNIVTNVPPVLTNGAGVPDPVEQGSVVTLQIEASDPDGTISSVTANLLSLGGTTADALYDDGAHNDGGAGDGTYGIEHTVSFGSSTGPASIPVTATDDSLGQTTVNVAFTVDPNPGPTVSVNMPKDAAGTSMYYFVPQETVTFTADVTDDHDVYSVTIDLSAIGGSSTAAMYDDNTHGDATPGDDEYTLDYIIPANVPGGSHTTAVTAFDNATIRASTQVNATIRMLCVKMHKPDFLNGVFALSTTDAYAVGERGGVYHYDGSDWYLVDMKNNVTTDKRVNDIHAFSTTGDAVIVGALSSASVYDGTTWTYQPIPTTGGTEFRGVWGSSPNDVYAVGGGSGTSHVWRWNGSAWTQMTLTSPPGDAYCHIDGFSSTQFILVGYNGTIIRGTGSTPSTWVDEGASASITEDLFGVCAVGSNDYFAVGGETQSSNESCVVYRSTTAGNWAQVTGHPTATGTAWLTAVWGSSPSNVWMVGKGGLIWHYNATTATFSVAASGTVNNLFAVWGTGTNDVWAAGAQGTLLHYGGSGWTVVSLSTWEDMEAIAGASQSGNDYVWVLDTGPAGASLPGSQILYLPPGTPWTTEANPQTSTEPFRDAFAINATDVWAVGDNASIIQRTGTGWSVIPPPGGFSGNFHSVWGRLATPTNLKFFGGDNGAFYDYDGATWTAHSGIASAIVDDVWGTSGGDLFCVAGSSLYSHDNTTTVFAADATVPGTGSLNSVWGTGLADVWVAGDGGRFAHRTSAGGAFGAVTLPGSPTADLNCVFGSSNVEVLVAGDNFALFRYDGTQWKEIPFHSTTDLFAGKASVNYVMFCGEHGVVYELLR